MLNEVKLVAETITRHASDKLTADRTYDSDKFDKEGRGVEMVAHTEKNKDATCSGTRAQAL